MRVASLSLALLAAPAFAFMPSAPVAGRRDVAMRAEGPATRRAFVQQTLGFAGALGLLAGGASAANAGFLNSDSLPEVIKPKDAEIDSDLVKSSDVQNELQNIRKWREDVASLSKELAGNPQTDLYSRVRKELDVSTIRDALNKVNTVFSEDTQRGTDRLVRIVLQDINELEAATRQRPGVPRSDKKIQLINKKLKKLEAAFAEILTYF